ncbi:DNA/RNA non-specific endonuclease [Prevotella fusca]|uniref:Endonuclease n=1 Tax=Prevotella fusca JCM 17724 TaxID=1236517 RepID=A0A0K1NMG2_9BACT|nr:DNA/RNA non-specific endonuclease [Prevotella fusca]AKU70277.1 endonuclease [Prevotella fusca JCM 17724]QUB85897.1 DNA/RNA non-specific endonuclease [Prevotella fusca JCM 17724]
MKRITLITTALSFSFLALTAFTSCSKDDDNSNDTGGKENVFNNTNSNLKDLRPVTHRLEFPKLKGGKSVILTHKLSDGEVNYSVEWDVEKKSNRWTCYQIYASNAKQTVKRKDQKSANLYPMDPLWPANAFFTYDPYRGSGYDHGHLCPSQDRVNSRESNDQTFYLSNMQPQVHDFNAGIWEVMERKMRTYITYTSGSKDTLFICRGGTIDKQGQYTYIRNNFIVPTYFFSAALMKYKVRGQGDWQYKAIGFWFKHESNSRTSLTPYVVSIKELEEKTGIDFFCNLPDNIEQDVENKTPGQMIIVWNIR